MMHAQPTRHSPLVIRSGRKLGPVMAVVLSVAVLCSGGQVVPLCIEDDGSVIVESILRLCCAQDPQHASEGSYRVASSSRDSCRDIFLTVEGTTESSHESMSTTVPWSLSDASQGGDLDGLPRAQLRPEEAVSVGHAGSALVHLSTVRILT